VVREALPVDWHNPPAPLMEDVETPGEAGRGDLGKIVALVTCIALAIMATATLSSAGMTRLMSHTAAQRGALSSSFASMNQRILSINTFSRSTTTLKP
jgi:hypothetical protein